MGLARLLICVSMIFTLLSLVCPTQREYVAALGMMNLKLRQIVERMTLDEKIAQLHGIHDKSDYHLQWHFPRVGNVDGARFAVG